MTEGVVKDGEKANADRKRGEACERAKKRDDDVISLDYLVSARLRAISSNRERVDNQGDERKASRRVKRC